jgi:hypothetical protein
MALDKATCQGVARGLPSSAWKNLNRSIDVLSGVFSNNPSLDSDNGLIIRGIRSLKIE